jgi:site-specific DNA-methyltransferase (adenine-specific)
MKLEIDHLYPINCIDLMDKMIKKPIFVDLTVTSPPYDDLRTYNGALHHFEFKKIARRLYKVTKVGGVLVWVVGDRINGGFSLTSFKQALYFHHIGFEMHDIMIYRKKNTPFMRRNAYTNSYEFMFVLVKGELEKFHPLKETTKRSGREFVPVRKNQEGEFTKVLKQLGKEKTRTNIWEYAVGLGGTTNDKIAFEHPAVFPESLARDHILSWSDENDLVFDPMCGSGTTCKMAKVLNRHYIGSDISKKYIRIAEERIKLAKPELTKKDQSSLI